LRERYETATKLEATNPSGALAIYSELSRGDGPWAANALYAAARLELELGRKSRAKQLLEQYQRRFPNGQNTEEARKLLQRLR
jgi:TolA-binding protein